MNTKTNNLVANKNKNASNDNNTANTITSSSKMISLTEETDV